MTDLYNGGKFKDKTREQKWRILYRQGSRVVRVRVYVESEVERLEFREKKL